jgi:hypothetical protein
MSRYTPPDNNITSPWDEEKEVTPKIVCPNPKCKNTGQDGSITAKSNQWCLTRICLKCGQKWSGGIGVQRADYSEPPSVPGVDTAPEEPPEQYTGSPFRDPKKNYDR